MLRNLSILTETLRKHQAGEGISDKELLETIEILAEGMCFLKALGDDYRAFLREILTNKYLPLTSIALNRDLNCSQWGALYTQNLEKYAQPSPIKLKYVPKKGSDK